MSKVATLIARKESLIAQLATIDSKIEAARVAESLEVGQTISVRHGRAETAKIVTGEVLAFDDQKVAVKVGEGLDAEIVKVFRAAIVVNGVGSDDGDVPEGEAAAANA